MACRVSGEVEIGVVSHIDNRSLICNRFIVNIKCVVFRKSKSDCGRHFSRERGISVRGDNLQFKAVPGGLNHLVRPVLPAVRATVEAVPVVILRQLVGYTVNCDEALVYAVCVSAY